MSRADSAAGLGSRAHGRLLSATAVGYDPGSKEGVALVRPVSKRRGAEQRKSLGSRARRLSEVGVARPKPATVFEVHDADSDRLGAPQG